MPDPEAELQYAANLSPVSPAPVCSAPSQVVSALQDTADTIDAMVAAAQEAAPNGVPEAAPEAGTGVDRDLHVGDIDDVVDDDSLNDPYGEEDTDTPAAAPEPQSQPDPELPDSNDDYAKTFDSPIGPEEVEDAEVQPEDVSSIPRESNDISLSSDRLNHRPQETQETPHVNEAPPPTSAQQAIQQGIISPASTDSSVSPEDRLIAALSRASQAASQSAPDPSTAKLDPATSESLIATVDIQRIVADLAASAESRTHPDPVASSPHIESYPGSGPLPSALPSAALPPRPPLPHAASQSYSLQQQQQHHHHHHHHLQDSNSNVPADIAAPPTSGRAPIHAATAPPGVPSDALGSLPVSPIAGPSASGANTSMNAFPYSAQSSAFPTDGAQDAEYQRLWDQFVADERQYMSEAKWDRFPEGSRIFIGNLSSDKVSKRDVFDMFHRFGRLAQISLKSAYGFVQYHTVEEGRRAIDNLQGTEIKGRRIHLEVSRVQDKSKKEQRVRSPDKGRGRDGGRRNDRYSHQNRDDYRPGGRDRSPPRRNDHSRDDGYGRDRGYYDGGRGRGRSRSPGYGRNGSESYRRRSPSPYARSRNHDDLDLPRRYGGDVPDVQIILQPDVSKEFTNWVDSAFKAKGLKTEVMYLHPRIPKDAVIKRQAAEGVHAVVDLDLRAQSTGRIPVQAFDRSGGMSNIRFDQYVDLEPPTAAEVILRAKASGSRGNYSQSYGGAGSFTNPYGGRQSPGAPPSYANGPQSQQYPAQTPANQLDMAALVGQMGHIDPATLQRLVASIQGGPQAAAPAAPPAGSNPAASANPGVDIQAILANLNANAQSAQQQAVASAPYSMAGYAAQPAPNGNAPSSGDSAAQVQNIMAQLARYR